MEGLFMSKKTFLAAVAAFCAASSIVLFLPYHQMAYLASRGNLSECQQTICCFIASVLFLAAFLRQPGATPLFGTKRNLFFLAMAVGSFFVGGETISWGQRLFYFQTSSRLMHVNLQAETNLHNLAFLKKHSAIDPKFLFPKILLVYFFLVPLFARFSRPFSDWTGKIRLPVLPLSLGTAFAAVILKFRFLPWEKSLALRQAYMQLKQSDIIFFVMMAALWFLLNPSKEAAMDPAKE